MLEFLRAHEIENIIALAGDPPEGQQEADWTPHPDGYHHSRELVEDALRVRATAGSRSRSRASPRSIRAR